MIELNDQEVLYEGHGTIQNTIETPVGNFNIIEGMRQTVGSTSKNLKDLTCFSSGIKSDFDY